MKHLRLLEITSHCDYLFNFCPQNLCFLLLYFYELRQLGEREGLGCFYMSSSYDSAPPYGVSFLPLISNWKLKMCSVSCLAALTKAHNILILSY